MLLSHDGARKEHEEAEAETTYNKLSATPLPYPLVLLRSGEEENSAVKLSLGRRKECGGRCFLLFLFLLILLWLD